MALQDQPQGVPPSLVDPKTGQPYPFGSPEYAAAISPWVTGQIKSQAENAANARGMFYSGPAMADEIQAQQGALSQMAQEGARQSVQEQELAQQEAFAAQQQKEQNEANMAAAKAGAKGAAVGGAIQGGTGALGTIGGLYIMNHMGPGLTQVTDAMAPITHEGAAMAPGFDAAGFPLGPSASGAAPDIASATDYSMSAPADFNFATAGTGAGGGAAPALGHAGAAPAAGPGVGAYGMGALAALPAAYYAAGAGERTFGNTTADKVGAGVGGALGAGLGGTLLGPAGIPLGAAAGSFIGPGVTEGFGKAGNWIGQRLGF